MKLTPVNYDPFAKGPKLTPVDYDPFAPPSTEFSASEMVSNIPASAKQFGKDIVQPVLHPIKTAKSLGNLALGVAQKAIPGEQEKEVYADQVGQFIMDRYGSVDDFKQTVMEDPVGVLADVATIFTGGGTAAAKVGTLTKANKLAKTGEVISKIGRTVDPVNVVGQFATKTAGHIPGLQGAAESLYQSGAKLPTSKRNQPRKTKAARDRNVRAALKERIMPTDKGLDKLDSIVSGVNAKIDDIIDAAHVAGEEVRTSQVFKKLAELRKEVKVPGPDALSDLRKLDKLASEFFESFKGKKTLSPKDLQDLKKRVYKRTDFDAKAGGADYITQEGRQAIGRDAREAVAALDPEIDALNARQAPLLDMQDDLARAANRIQNTNSLSLSNMLMGIGGGFMGAPAGASGATAGAALGVLASTVNHPRVQARAAILMQQLIDTGHSREMAANLSLILAAQGMRQAGRLEQSEVAEPEDGLSQD